MALYFNESSFLANCAYNKTLEKSRGGIELREYWQTEDTSWLHNKKAWAGLRSIAMTRNTITKNDVTSTETRYFISSLPSDTDEIARAIRKHWMVESYHWHLDVTFREDANRTIEKDAAYNLNIIRKLAINTLKLLEVSIKNVSLKGKRFLISMNLEKYLDDIMLI